MIYISIYKKILSLFNLTPQDVVSIFKGAIVAILGALGTYFLQWATRHDFGAYTPIIVAILSAVLNTGRKSIDEPVQKATGISI